MKIVIKNSTENCHFNSREKSLYVAWACFRNDKRLNMLTKAFYVYLHRKRALNE